MGMVMSSQGRVVGVGVAALGGSRMSRGVRNVGGAGWRTGQLAGPRYPLAVTDADVRFGLSSGGKECGFGAVIEDR